CLMAAATASPTCRASEAWLAASTCSGSPNAASSLRIPVGPRPGVAPSRSHAARSSASGMAPVEIKRAVSNGACLDPWEAGLPRLSGIGNDVVQRDGTRSVHDQSERGAVEGAEHHYQAVALVGQVGDRLVADCLAAGVHRSVAVGRLYVDRARRIV